MSPAHDPVASDTALEAARAAIKLNLITRAQLDECVQLARQISSLGLPKSVNQMLVEKNYISQGHLNSILQSLGKPLAEIDHYDILAKLGEGGMGAIYKVRDKSTSRVYALKVLKRELAKDGEYLERFQREIRTTLTLSHPNIVSAVESGQDRGLHYYVMEFVDGESLESRIDREGRLTEQECAHIAIQVAGALAYANTHRIVHRDIKPANIMVGRDGSVKLCDLGIAKSMDSGMTLTMTGMAVGSPHYLSPEQAQGDRNMDIRSDIYSLGLTLYHMITGRFPFDADNPHAVVMMRLKEDPPHPQTIVPHLSNRMTAVVMKMIAREPLRRYQTPEEVITDLVPIAKGLPDIPAPPPPPIKLRIKREAEPVIPKKTKPPRSKRPILIAGIGGAAELILLLLLLLPKSDPASDPPPRDVSKVGPLPRREDPKLPEPDVPSAEEKRKKEALVVYNRARNKYQQGDFLGAIEECNRALQLHPGLAEASALKVEAEKAEAERRRKAEENANAEEARKKEGAEHYERAREKYQQGDYSGAIIECDKALLLHPGLADATRLKEDAKKAEDDHQRKVAEARAEEERRKNEALRHYNEGADLYDRGDYTGALASWKKALELNPAMKNQVQPWIENAQEKLKPVSDDVKRKKEAADHYQKGEGLYAAGKYADAIQEYTRSLTLDPNNAEVFHARAMAYDEQNDYKKAVADYDKAIQLNPNFSEAFNNRGLTKYKSKDLPGALKDLDQAIKLNPKYSVAFFNRGAIRKDSGDRTGAIADWEKAIKLDPAYKEKLQPRIDVLKRQ